MKIVILSLLLLSIVVSIRPPNPYCRSSPIPNIYPIAINSTLRFDLEQVFDGYNLDITGPARDNINVLPKYLVNNNTFDKEYNFSTAKIKAHNRFLGLIINEFVSELVIGTNSDDSGVKVDQVVHIEDIPNLHCYDVDQIVTRNQTYAVIDCGLFKMGELVENHFLYVDLNTGQKVLGGKTTESFVKYNHISKRNIEVIQDPFNRILYILRIYTRDGVDQAHQNNTFIEFFMIRDVVDPQILDVLDYTLLDLKELSIADYQVMFGRIYVLAYNRGLYEIDLTRDQKVQMRSFFEIKMDMTRFKVDRIGFNDDLYVAITNGNQIYTYEWDVISPPKMIQKYGLIGNSKVQQIVCNTQFIMVLASNQIDGKFQRNHWIFSRRSTSYTHAFNVFRAPDYGPAIMQWQGNDRTFHLFHATNSYSIKINLPLLEIKPVPGSRAGQKQQYTVTATSMGETQNKTCIEKFTFIYQYPNDTTIYKTGFNDLMNITVDSPDEQVIDLGRQFYGRNLSYNVTYQSGSSALLPHTYVDKIHQAMFTQIKEIKPENIVWFEMFQQSNPDEPIPNSVYGLVQVIQEATKNQTTKIYTAHYIHCQINVMGKQETHSLKCRIISSTRFGYGKIIMGSQMYDYNERRLALVFDGLPNTVFVYYFWQAGFGFYGRRDYAGDAWNILTSVTISKGKLFVTLANSKRLEIYNLLDIREDGPNPKVVNPIFIINSDVMKFFGIDYWAPLKTKVSQFHDQVIFVKTKIGIMAINVNEDGMPQLLFHVQTNNGMYDFEVNQQTLLILGEDLSSLYHLYTPLRRTKQPYLRQTIHSKFNLIDYDQITADRLFYIVGFNELIVINPYFTNTNAVYAEIKLDQIIMSIDAVNIRGRELLFIHTPRSIIVYAIRESPVLYVEWPSHQRDFNMTLSAYNPVAKSEPYNFLFNVLDLNETQIQPTQKFNQEEIKKIGHVRVRQNQKRKFTFNVTFNDTQWFEGNVFHYTINCTHCGKNQNIRVKNHVEQVQQLVAGRAIYDMQSTWNGIYAQQYNSYLKTWAHNDSIQYIQNIPTIHRGQVCSKIVIADNHQYVVSLCQTGNQVNVYLTTLISDKPFTSGPFPTQAKAVNFAKIVEDMLMIVDNQDDPFVRNGGIYLYSLNFDSDEIQMSMIDYIDNEDLQIEGFNGQANIGSADFHDSHGIQQYRMFITDARSGNIFILGFELTPDRNEIIYLSKKMLVLKDYIPAEVKAPTRLKLITLTVHYYLSYQEDNIAQYYLLITTANWHHMELKVKVDRTDTILDTKLVRMFERVPGWTLKNYFRLRRDWEKSQFAVPYVNYELNRQVVAIYEADWIIFNPDNDKKQIQENNKNLPAMYHEMKKSLTKEEDVILAEQTQKVSDQLVHIPLVPMLGVHRVLDTYEVAFAFHLRNMSTLLFTDMDGYNITQLEINQNVTLQVKDIQQPDTVNITAHNPYNNFTFAIELKYIDQDVEQRQQFIWIVIVVLGVLMIFGLFIVYCRGKSQARQSDKESKRTGAPVPENQQSLITVEDKYREDYINRTSVDPESIRGTIDLGLGDSLLVRENNNESQEHIEGNHEETNEERQRPTPTENTPGSQIRAEQN